MKSKIMKVILAIMMAFGIQVSTMSQAFATENTIKDGTYAVIAKLQNATNISKASMAAAALKSEAVLTVKGGKYYATVEFQSANIMGMKGDAHNIKYYADSSKSEKLTPTNITYREDNSAFEKTVELPLTVNELGTYGVYINITVDSNGSTLMTPDAYVLVDVKAGVQAQLETVITSAEAFKESDYTVTSYATLKTALEDAQTAIDNGSDEMKLSQCLDTLQAAIAGLKKVQTPVVLKDGSYSVKSDVLQSDGTQSMAAQAVKSATLTAKDGVITVDLVLGSVTVYGQTAYIDKMEIENKTRSYSEATVTSRDSEGHVTGVQFVLPENIEKTNVNFYYGGNQRGSSAVLYLGLNDAKAVTSSVFSGDGTYEVNIALWNATKDEASMAASAIGEKATVLVQDGKATMYITSKQMKMGTIIAYLQELKIKNNGDYVDAKIESKDESGNPTLFSFELPSEEEYLTVKVNPHVAMMGNQDIDARVKVDYASLTKVSTEIKSPVKETTNKVPDSSQTPSETPKTPTQTTTQTGTTAKKAIKTSDETQLAFIGGLLIVSCATFLFIFKKKAYK